VISSTGARYSLPNNTILNGGSLAFATHKDAVTYAMRPSKGHYRVRIKVFGGRSRVVVTAQPQAPPVFAPDDRVVYASGTRIAYVDGPSLIATGLPNGATIVYVAASPQDPMVFAATVVWGNAMAASQHEAIYRVAHSGSRRLVGGFDALSELAQARWNPDGSAIAFIRSGTSHGGDLYVVNAQAKLRRLTSSGRVSGPVWSPDGKEIAFTQRYGYRPHRSNGIPELTTVALATGKQRRLTYTKPLPPPIKGAPFNGNYITPGSVAAAWSPNGRDIAIVTQGTALGIVAADGGPIHTLYTLKGPRVSSGIGPVAWPYG
jgi:tricorn protease-like protein